MPTNEAGGDGRVVTIAIVVQVHDGVVLASDSASTLITSATPDAPPQIVNVYNNANKIFNLRKGFPIGGMTFGAGSIGSSSIATLSKDLRVRFSGDDRDHPDWTLQRDAYTIEEVAEKVRDFLFTENFKALGVPAVAGAQLGFIVAGYSAGSQLSEAWIVEIINGECAAPRLLLGRGVSGVNAGGDPEVFSRLVFGHGQQLASALHKGGVPAEQLPQVIAGLQAEMHIPLVEAPMPIQDAIDFAEFLAQTTVAFTRFKRGAATVGGPVESAAITKHEGFKWVHRKHYFDKSLNPEDGYGTGSQAHCPRASG